MLITAAVKKVEVSRIQPTCSLRDKMETYCGWKKILHQLVDDLPHCTPIICSVSLWPNSYQLVLDFVHPQYGKLCLISDKSKPTKIECWDLFCKTTGFAHQHVPGGYPRGPGRNNHRLSKKTLSVDWIKFYCVKSESLALAIKSEYKASSLHDSQRGTARSYHPPQFWWRIFTVLPMEFVNRVHWA